MLPDHCDIGTTTTQADVLHSLSTCPEGCGLWHELRRSKAELETKVSALQEAVKDMAEAKAIEDQGRIINICKFPLVVGTGCVILLILVEYCRYHLQTKLLEPKKPEERNGALVNQCFRSLDSTFPNAEDDIVKRTSIEKVLKKIAKDDRIEQKFKQRCLDLLSKRKNREAAV